MCDRPCTCIYTHGKRWDDQSCPHPEHGTTYRADRTVRVCCRNYYPGELLDH